MLTFWGSRTNTYPLDVADQVLQARVTRSDQTVFADLWLRLQPLTWVVRPFVEGVVGFKGLSSEYKLGLVGGLGETTTQRDQHLAHNLGFGVGVDVLIGQNATARAYVTLAFRWLQGSKAPFAHTFEATHSSRVNLEVPTTTSIVLLGITATADFAPALH